MSIVEESDLDVRQFQCCGDEDLYPFGCPGCGRLMVFCYECDTLYDDLNNLNSHSVPLNNFDTSAPAFACPQCKYGFPYFYIRDGQFKVSRDTWMSKGFHHLLRS